MSSSYIRLPLVGTASTPFLQVNSFAVDDSDNSKLEVPHRDSGTSFNFSTAFTIIIPFKSNWVTGPTTNYLMDIPTIIYMQIDNTGDRFVTRQFDATTNEFSIHTLTTPLSDGDWVFVGITYDGAGGYQFVVNDSLETNAGTKVLLNGLTDLIFGERSGFTVSQDITMGNILILNKVATAPEVSAYYNSGVSVDAYSVFDTSEIVHYYKADDLTQQTIVMDSGGVTATLRGAITVNGLLKVADVPS